MFLFDDKYITKYQYLSDALYGHFVDLQLVSSAEIKMFEFAFVVIGCDFFTSSRILEFGMSIDCPFLIEFFPLQQKS